MRNRVLFLLALASSSLALAQSPATADPWVGDTSLNFPVVADADDDASATPPTPSKAGGKWTADLSAAVTATAGNNNGTTVNLSADAETETADDKLSIHGDMLQTSERVDVNGVTTSTVTGFQWRLGTRYDSNLSPQYFGFIGGELSHDMVRQLALRSVLSSGLGQHLIKTRERRWDVYAGLALRTDRYDAPGVLINNVLETELTTLELLLGEESSHRFTPSARFKQKFELSPSVGNDHGVRATFDSGFLFDLNQSLSLNVKLQARYDSLAQAPAENYDLLLMTGISVKLSE